MNWISFLNDTQRTEGAKALKKAAEYLEAKDPKVVNELAYVLGIAIQVTRNFGLDPTALLHKGVDWVVGHVAQRVTDTHHEDES